MGPPLCSSPLLDSGSDFAQHRSISVMTLSSICLYMFYWNCMSAAWNALESSENKDRELPVTR